MDTATSDIRAVPCRQAIAKQSAEREFTPSRGGPSHGVQANHCRTADSPILPELLGQIHEDEQIGTGDRRRNLRHAQMPFRHHRARGRSDHSDPEERPRLERRRPGDPRPERNPALRPGLLKAMDRIPRPKPDRGEDAMPKSFGERITARDPDRQTAEIHIRIALMNRLEALGTAEIVRVA